MFKMIFVLPDLDIAQFGCLYMAYLKIVALHGKNDNIFT